MRCTGYRMAVCIAAVLGVMAAAGAATGEVVVSRQDARIADRYRGAGDDPLRLPYDGVGEWFEVDGPSTVTVTVTAAGAAFQDTIPRFKIIVQEPYRGVPAVRVFETPSEEYRDYTFTTRVNAGVFIVWAAYLNRGCAAPDDSYYVRMKEFRVEGARLCATPPTVKELTDPFIRAARMGTLVVRTRPGERVTVKQERHAFQFGTCLSGWLLREGPDGDRYRETVAGNFNAAVHENALKWYSAERNAPGNPDYTGADRMLEWCEEHDIGMRGHCIYWGIERYVMDWQKEMDDEALYSAMKRRGREVTARYRGRIGEYDLNNEMVHGDYYRDRFGKGMVEKMAAWAKEGDNGAVLYVNDYLMLNSRDIDPYIAQIRDFTDRGIPVGGIGCQGHYGIVDNVHVFHRTLDRLSAFGLPIKVTELDVQSEDEMKKAESFENIMRVCFAHPSMEGILLWGFWEKSHWRPKAALWKADWTPTPTADAYRRLVFGEWWTDWEGVADDDGLVEVPVFHGTHRVDACGQWVNVTIGAGDDGTEITMGL